MFMANYKDMTKSKVPAIPQGMQGGQGGGGQGGAGGQIDANSVDLEMKSPEKTQCFEVQFINSEMKDVLKAASGDEDKVFAKENIQDALCRQMSYKVLTPYKPGQSPI